MRAEEREWEIASGRERNIGKRENKRERERERERER